MTQWSGPTNDCMNQRLETLTQVVAHYQTPSARNLRQDQNGGWVLLLPSLGPGEGVLCLELGSLEYCGPLIYWHGDVDVLARRPGLGQARHTIYRGGQEGVMAAVDWEPGQRLPFGSGTFAGIVIRLAGAAAPAQFAALSLGAAFWREIRRVLASTGFTYLEINGNLSLGSLENVARGAWSQVNIGPRRRKWLSQLKIAGLGVLAVYPLLNERGELAEILTEADQVLPPEPVGFRERAKLRLLGPWGRRHFASAYGLLSTCGRRPTLLDELLLVCDAAAVVSGTDSGGSPYRAGRIAVTPGKVFVQCVRASSPDGSLFVVVPMNHETLGRRRRELAAITALRATQLEIATLLPSIAREAQCRGRTVFVYSEIRGRTIDRPVPQLSVMIQCAFELLAEFNRASQRDIIMDQSAFDACVGTALSGAVARYPTLELALARLRSEFDRHLSGRHCRVGWLHGDFKIENLLFDMREIRVTGVIDWELASPVGFLMVDLLYLLAYGRVTEGAAADVLDVVEVAILGGCWTAQERTLIDDYVRRFNLPLHYMTLASAFFVVHHIGMRFTYAITEADWRVRLNRILENLTARLEAVSVPGFDS